MEEARLLHPGDEDRYRLAARRRLQDIDERLTVRRIGGRKRVLLNFGREAMRKVVRVAVLVVT